ncbi:MAG: 5-(carboxyamino)imidazole ribonucleotide synthase [Chloroflexota bacterium]
MSNPILPGATIGILGSGQLGRMLALAARRMGYRVVTFSSDNDSPTGQVSDREFVAPYDYLPAARTFAQAVDVVTYEFENIPAQTAATIAETTPVRPNSQVLHITQNRLREKMFCKGQGLPVTSFAPVAEEADLSVVMEQVGTPSILKTAAAGYDGKGQVRIGFPDELASAWDSIGRSEAILEAEVDFVMEASVVCARSITGEFAHYGLIENRHERHILDLSIAPTDVPVELEAEAVDIARCIVEGLEYVGVLCVEFFLTADGRILVNEIAPRPHNSGHLTIEACVTSQFEQQLRAVCGLPLGDATYVRPAAMANLLGDLWSDGEPNWAALAGHRSVKLHLYGKHEARPGRKMGHLTALANSGPEAAEQALAARHLLTEKYVSKRSRTM